VKGEVGVGGGVSGEFEVPFPELKVLIHTPLDWDTIGPDADANDSSILDVTKFDISLICCSVAKGP